MRIEMFLLIILFIICYRDDGEISTEVSVFSVADREKIVNGVIIPTLSIIDEDALVEAFRDAPASDSFSKQLKWVSDQYKCLRNIIISAMDENTSSWQLLHSANETFKSELFKPEALLADDSSVFHNILHFHFFSRISPICVCLLYLLDLPKNAVDLKINHLQQLDDFENNLRELQTGFFKVESPTQESFIGFLSAIKESLSNKLYFVTLLQYQCDFQSLIYIEEHICSICYEEQLTQECDFAILSSCQHRFCVPCVIKWFKEK